MATLNNEFRWQFACFKYDFYAFTSCVFFAQSQKNSTAMWANFETYFCREEKS